MNRILALQVMSTKFVTNEIAASVESVYCSSDSNACSAMSLKCILDDSFMLEW